MFIISDLDGKDFVYDLTIEVKNWIKENNSNISDLEDKFRNILEEYREY